MAIKCKVCEKPVSKFALKIECCVCLNSFHANCVNMDKAKVEAISSQKAYWRCPPCLKIRRSTMYPAYGGEEMIAKLFNDLRSDFFAKLELRSLKSV